jgi:phosphoserine phosphatase
MNNRLICFDLDGTLIPHTTSSGHLALALGHAAELEKLEDGYAAGRYSNRDV